MGVCNCSMFCCTLLYVNSSIAIILMGKRELVALLNLSPWCLVMVERHFPAVPRGCLRFVIVVFPDHTHLLFFIIKVYMVSKDKTPPTERYTCTSLLENDNMCPPPPPPPPHYMQWTIQSKLFQTTRKNPFGTHCTV